MNYLISFCFNCFEKFNRFVMKVPHVDTGMIVCSETSLQDFVRNCFEIEIKQRNENLECFSKIS